MELHGKHLIGGTPSAEGKSNFTGINPTNGEKLMPEYIDATEGEIDRAVEQATAVFDSFHKLPAERLAGFLDKIAEEIVGLGDDLIRRAQMETALPEARLVGERARTVNQIKMFADLLREGSWVEACIDRAMPDRKPLPKPDVRRMLIPLGPVVVFAASNFPLAFSVAGGDTASALAASCPVVVKAHPAHPGTSEMVGRAIESAAKKAEIPAGVFSLLHGSSHELGLRLVKHVGTRAVGFTGSLRAGRALFDVAAARPEPIPVYAEMGSTNPVFVLPGALKKNAGAIAEGLMQSVTLGVGQFCTNPGLVFGVAGAELDALVEKAAQAAAAFAPGAMLYKGIAERYGEGVKEARGTAGVRVAGQSTDSAKDGYAGAVVLNTDAKTFLQSEALKHEVFGPATVVVNCLSAAELEKVARELPGQLTATIHGTEEDLAEHKTLISILQQKVGRLLFNGFPTGVEVCPSMHHGGPYPATTNPYFTSVGTAAIKRFARPIAFQNCPSPALPPELQNNNPRNIWRLVDGQFTKDGV